MEQLHQVVLDLVVFKIAAGEALTGGLSGLATSGEYILGSAIGGGIGAAVNSALATVMWEEWRCWALCK